MIIFFVAIGFPTLLNTNPSFGYEGIEWTPVTSYYQEAYAQQEVMQTLAIINYNPIVASAFLVIPTTLDNPPPDPAQYFELKYGQPITIEQGFVETETFQEQFSPQTVRELFTAPQNNLLNINNFEILPKAFGGAPPPPPNQTLSDVAVVVDQVTITELKQSVCDSNIGEANRVACYTFDVADCSGNICTNFGTFGSIADANHTTSNRASTVGLFLNSSAVINEAIRVNGTDFGTPLTEVHLGDFADRSQWDFLFDDNEANVTSINYWLMQDIDGGGGQPFYGTMGMGQEELGSLSYIWIGGRNVGGFINMIVEENSVNRIFTVNSAIGVPDDNNFHMVTIIMDKQNATSTVKYCVDGSSNCTTINRASAWSNAISQTSVQDLTIGEIDCANIGASGCNNTYLQMDDLAIWKEYQLTDEDIDNLFNLATAPQQVFNVTITDSVTATDGSGQDGANIALSNLKVYHRFDLADKFNNGLSTLNLGTLGSDADAQYFIPNTNLTATDIVTNTTGLISESIFQDGDVDGVDRAEVRMGVFADRAQYNFLHKANVGSNLTSINFWINGDTVGGADYPILDTIEASPVGASGGNGMTIFTANGNTFLSLIYNDITFIQDEVIDEPPNDGQWHMVTVRYDKGNLTGSASVYGQICIDGSANCLDLDLVATIPASTNDANNTLTIGSRHDSFGNIVENKFNIDDLAVWNGHQITDAEIDELFNGGAGKPVIGQSLLNVTLIQQSVFNVTITDTVEVIQVSPQKSGNVVIYNSMTEQALFNNRAIVPLVAEVVGVGEDVTIGETVVFDFEDLTSVRLKISSPFSHLTDGNITAVLWDDDATIGVDETQDFTELARSSTVDMATEWVANGLIIDPNPSDIGNDFIWQFNFTGTGTQNLNGTYLVGFEVRGISGSDELALWIVNESENYPFVFSDGRCWESGASRHEAVDDTVNFCDVSVNSLYDHLQIKVFGNSNNVTDQVIFDNSHEVLFQNDNTQKGGNNFIDDGGRHGGSGFFEQGKNGTDGSTWDVVGNVMPLTDHTITKVVMPLFDCGGVDGEFQLQSVIYDVPTEGVSTTPTIQSVSDIFTIPSCVRIFPTGVFTDIQFNFTNAPELTGDYFIGFRENGTGASSPKFYPAWDISANQSRPLEFCVGCVTPAVEDVEAWTRYGTGNANWTSAQGDGVTDSGGTSFSVFSMIVFAEQPEAGITLQPLDPRTYPDPYLYMDFDVSSIRPDLSTWQNLGKASSLADGLMRLGIDNSSPENSVNMTISIDDRTLFAGGLLGEAVFVNSTGGSTGDTATWVYFGQTANKTQWKFLEENNDDGVTLGSNLTSVNFWVTGDLTGTNTITSMLATNGGSSSTPNFNINTRIPNTEAQIVVGENAIRWQRVLEGSPNIPIEDPDDGIWHMVTVTMNKTSGIGEICVDTVCVVDPFDSNFTSTITATIRNQLTLNTPPRHTSQSGSVDQQNFFADELAVWDDHILTSTEKAFLYNGGNGTRVLTTFGDASQGFNNMTLSISDSVGVSDITPVTDGGDSIQEEEPEVWQIREHKTNSTTSIDVDFEVSGSNALGINNNASAGHTGIAWIFKVFDDTELENFATIEPIGKPLVVDVEVSTGGTGTLHSIVHVYDCDLTAFGQSDFEDNLGLPSCTESPAISGDGKLNGAPTNTTMPFARQDLSDQIDIDEITPHTSNRTTVLIGLIDESTSNTFEAVIHSITIGNNETGSRTWDFTAPVVNYTSTGSESDAGLIRGNITDSGRTYSKPYLYVDFNEDTILASVTEWKNLGKAGEIANAFMRLGIDNLTPETNIPIEISFSEGTLHANGVLNEAVFMNSTGGSTGDTATWVYLGATANKTQWKFLEENNDDGVTLGSNFTSVNFWVTGDLTGTNTITSILATHGASSASPNFNINTRIPNTEAQIVVGESGILQWQRVLQGSPNIPVEATDGSGTWHMITVTMNKITDVGQICVDNVCVVDAFDDSFPSTITATIRNQLTLNTAPRHTSQSGSVDQQNFFADELAVWDNHILTSQEMDFLFNNGNANPVLVNASQIVMEEVMIDTATTSDQVVLEVRDARSYPDPYLYLNFDESNVKSNGTVNSLFNNLGTSGSLADGQLRKGTDNLTPEGSDNVTASVASDTLISTGLLGEAVRLNSTGGSSGDTALWVYLGATADKTQWKFLEENNDDGVTLGSNFTSVNFWVTGTLTGTNTITSMLATDGGSSPSPNFNINTRLPNNEAQIVVGESGALQWQRVLEGTPNIPVEATDGSGTWHMITVTMNKITDEGQICVDNVCVDDTFDNSFPSSITATIRNQLTINTAPRHTGQSSSVDQQNFFMDELAVWDNTILNETQRTFLFSNGNGQPVLIPDTNQTETDFVNVSDQVTVKKQFVSIDNLEVYWKFDTITPTYESEFIDPTEWNQTGTEIQINNSTTSGHLELKLRENQDGLHGIAHQFSSDVSDTNWVVRFDVQHVVKGSVCANQSIMPVWFGISDTDETVSENEFISPLADSIGFYFGCTTAFNNPITIQTVHSNNARAISNNDNFLLLPNVVGERDWYLEIIRNSATSATWNFYNDAGYTDLRNSTTRTISAGTDGMNFLKFTGDRPNSPSVGVFDWNVDKVKFWNATSDIHTELHTEDFANIDDADSISDSLMNKTEIGILGNAWKAHTTGVTNVIIGGTNSSYNYILNGDTTFNFWIIEGQPDITPTRGTVWTTQDLTQGSTLEGGSFFQFDYDTGEDNIFYRTFDSPTTFISAFSSVGSLNNTDPEFHMWTMTRNFTTGDVLFYKDAVLDASNLAEPTCDDTPANINCLMGITPRLFTRSEFTNDFTFNNATLDEFSAWSRALNSSEISTLYNDGVGLMLNNFNAQQNPPQIFNVEITDTVSTSDQTATNLPFVPIDNLEAYWKFDHITPTYESEFIDTSEWQQTGTHMNIDNSTTSGQLEIRLLNDQTGIHAISHQLSGNASDTEFVLRFPIQKVNGSDIVDDVTIFAVYGISSTDHTTSIREFISPLADSIGLRIDYQANTEIMLIQTVWSDDARAISNNVAIVPDADFRDIYVEIIRNSATSVTWNLYNDTGYTELWKTTTSIMILIM